MLLQTTSAEQKRKLLRSQLASGKLLQFPGAFSPLVAMQIEKLGFQGVYISGSVLSNDLGYPDIGLTTLSEVAQRGRQIARVTALPSIIDADTGFGEVLNVHRTIQELIELGLAGCHLEDQVNPKRCGHLDGKAIVPTSEMLLRVRAAAQAKAKAPDFVIIARTDARSIDGLQASIERAKAYVDAGADAIFPEALEGEREFETFRKAVSVPILANMTEFGKSKLLSKKTLESLGVNIVIYPVTLFRLALKSSWSGLESIRDQGSQESLLPSMFTRAELYELTRYAEYNQMDQNLYNFKVKS